MDENLNYKTFIYIESNKLIISVIDDLDNKVYEENLIIKINQDFDNFIFNQLDYFLNKNIFKIEKKINNFIEKIFIILDYNDFFNFEISVKKNNYENSINLKDLTRLLHDAKNYCKKTIDKKKILHMIINNYNVDNKNYNYLPEGISCNNFSLDIGFICISQETLVNLEKIFKKYQISLGKVVSAVYIKKFLTNDEEDIFSMTKKIIDGHNPNEVKLIEKTTKNQGFFEKFFNLFT